MPLGRALMWPGRPAPFLGEAMATRPCDALVIGGGFFGCRLALRLRDQGLVVCLAEAEPSLLRRASFRNQARVHNGYHYPRSVLTALRSRVNFPHFLADYSECLRDGFTQIYAVSRAGSWLSAREFASACERVGAPLEPARAEIRGLFSADLIEDVFEVREAVFDADRLRARLSAELAAAGVDLRLGWRAERIGRASGGLRTELRGPGGEVARVDARAVYNCTYSQLNRLLAASGLPLIPLKHELTEMPLISMPAPLRDLAVTVMDGPFFSVMPFPPRDVHTLSHVRYTPHRTWRDGPGGSVRSVKLRARRPGGSSFPRMRQDAQRYLPLLAEAVHQDSMWEIKTLLPASEDDDSRPILYRRDHGLPGLTCVLGGKIDNVYDVLQELDPAAPAAIDGASRRNVVTDSAPESWPTR